MMKEKQVKTIILAKINKTDNISDGNSMHKRAPAILLEGE